MSDPGSGREAGGWGDPPRGGSFKITETGLFWGVRWATTCCGAVGEPEAGPAPACPRLCLCVCVSLCVRERVRLRANDPQVHPAARRAWLEEGRDQPAPGTLSLPCLCQPRVRRSTAVPTGTRGRRVRAHKVLFNVY